MFYWVVAHVTKHEFYLIFDISTVLKRKQIIEHLVIIEQLGIDYCGKILVERFS